MRVNPGKKVCDFRCVFYVTPNFALLVDAILGLNSMKELQMEIKPGANVAVYQGLPSGDGNSIASSIPNVRHRPT